jgi:hypothetical protein
MPTLPCPPHFLQPANCNLQPSVLCQNLSPNAHRLPADPTFDYTNPTLYFPHLATTCAPPCADSCHELATAQSIPTCSPTNAASAPPHPRTILSRGSKHDSLFPSDSCLRRHPRSGKMSKAHKSSTKEGLLVGGMPMPKSGTRVRYCSAAVPLAIFTDLGEKTSIFSPPF